MSVTLIGDTSIRDGWDSGARELSDSTDRVTLIKRGLLAALEAIMPDYGATDILESYMVDRAVLRPGRGGWSELIIDLLPIPDDDSIELPEGALDSTIETDMAQLERPIMSHDDGYANEIAKWRDEPNPALRTAMKYMDNGTEQTLSQNAQKYAKLILQGIESYLVFAPVITRTTIYAARVPPQHLGMRVTPPVTVPGTWEYLKTADKCSQLGKKKWQRTEQWTGAKEWSHDLYDAAT